MHSPNPTIFADGIGIHLPIMNGHTIIHWGEIESVDAARFESGDGTSFLEVYVNHLSGVDFRFHSTDAGYEQVIASMEQHLLGFTRAQAEAAGTWEQKLDLPVIWKRDEALQPFQLQPPVVDPRDPTPEERARTEAAHQASIATCEKVLGRTLGPDELACVHTGFENGRIVGSIRAPLCHQLTAAEPRS